jgi:AcrR family transcriptional regulator
MINTITLAGQRTPKKQRRVALEDREDFKQKLQMIAVDLFAKEGYEAVSIRRIAAQAGCSPMTLYNYFPSKHFLLRTLWQQIFERLHESCIAAIKVQRLPQKKLKAYLMQWIKFWIDQPESYKVVFLESDTLESPGESYFAQEPVAQNLLTLMIDLIHQTYDISTDELTEKRLVQILLAQSIGYLHLYHTAPELGWADDDKLTDALVDSMMLVLSSNRKAAR